MTISTAIQSAATAVSPAVAPLTHTVTAAGLGAGFSAFVVWNIETFAHRVPPTSVDEWFTAIGIVAASWLLQKISA